MAPKTLKMCHVNVRSLLAATRLLDLEILCANNDIDILCLTETWLSSSNAKPGCSNLNLPGFQPPIRCDRVHKRGGGVAVYVRRGLTATPVSFPDILEAVCLKVLLPQRKFLHVVAIYRPPKGNVSPAEFVSYLESAVDSIKNSANSTICIVGDFNAKHSIWWDGQASNEPGELLFNYAMTNGFAQVIEGPTRDPNGPAAAQLDLMFINNVDLLRSFNVLSEVADHCPTVLTISVNRHRGKCRYRESFDFNNANLPDLAKFLQDVDWSPVLSSEQAEDALDSWYRIFFSAVHHFVPQRRTAVHPNNKPWYSSFLHRLRRHRDRLFNRSRGLPSDHQLNIAYRKVRNWYVAELRYAERTYYVNLGRHLSDRLSMRDSHRWWAAAKSACGLKANVGIPPLQENGRTHVSAHDKAATLNRLFADQCSAPTASTPLPDVSGAVVPAFEFDCISVSEVSAHLQHLNVWKATGLDRVCHRLLKACARGIATPLCHIVNLSLSSGSFPSAWKRAVIKPLFKNKNNRSDPKSYRPVALLSCLSKVVESFVRKQLLRHCFSHSLIPDEQFGFMPKRSVVWQLLAVLDDWDQALDRGDRVHACFLDVSKAFDRVDHGLLLLKLSSIGLKGTELAWFESYLRDRSICTEVDGSFSDFQPISSGVPQGSVLGPLLFIIYFNDLPSAASSSCSCALFADDTLLYDPRCKATASPSCCQLQKGLSQVETWACNWATTFNASKSAHILRSNCTRKRQDNHAGPLFMNDQPIPAMHCVKHLGLVVSAAPDWSEHVKSILQRVNYRVYTLKRLAHRCESRFFVKRMFESLVRPILEFASPVWDSCRRSDQVVLERVQLSVARAVLRQSRISFSNRKVLQDIGWPTLAWRRRRYKLLLLWRLLHGDGPPSLCKAVPPLVSSRASYSFRNRNTVSFPCCSTVRRLKSFLPSAILLWNSLPSSITEAISSPSFISKLDLHFSADKFSFGLP